MLMTSNVETMTLDEIFSDLRTVNVVARARLAGPRRLDTKLLASRLRNSQYGGDLTNARSVTLRFPLHSTVVKVYESGSMVVVGARSASSARSTLRAVARRIQRVLRDVRGLEGFRVVHTVWSFKMRRAIDRVRTYERLCERFFPSYEPEINTALTVPLEDLRVKACLHKRSGAVFGVKRDRDAYLALQLIAPLLVYVGE
ncbi:hypothetical protein GUITHDRAFT_119551 [Guillardia theta CCMP2712]|uniref:Uncharacterized protein n=1 Tax=Guillardia theta (strain CCMP2712) TaxID=905079 RepID=L1IDE2_GUITC|nr:hypothetical protein GUITHDRAFT_119550 [Guillardia theta CCMP2712]XP_005821238.1 hypothetical protein GUITHDRAFT_119551 [Guillardia theta CCMP2712]EKX34257.1 hypothetical protein GUITHDRAFT_119550 [Guillardia theta CCMP2712]EKX34258.1 hypothetical protein GUITHDRAFT_119551 [Guillardia theta CCMP2712]|eukprot:XP_005821237.1 hypothetical protein GUITHDRAFT_119550 [Guillardia theta CCMP2712]